MSTYSYLYAPEAKEAICLYKSIPSRKPPFEGVIVYIPDRYWLPPKYLQLLIDRFSSAHHGKVMFIEDHALWKLLGEDDQLITIGGDSDRDLPLTTYLPEVRDPQVQAEIKASPELMIQ
jgi:hypothetical protein